MLQITQKIVTEIHFTDDYYVEMVEHDQNEIYTDFWLCKRGYGIKYHMYGLNNKETSFQKMIDILMNNITEEIEAHEEDFI